MALSWRCHGHSAHVPALGELAFTNVLRTACLRQRLDAQREQAIVTQTEAMRLAALASGVGWLAAG
jgi:hypothetical protein